MSSQNKRVVVVTGASRGLGLEWVRQLSKEPETFVIAVVRNVDRSTLLQPLLGPNVVAVQGDLSDLNSFSVTADAISRIGGGKVDLLINNAGIMSGAGADFGTGISKSSPEEWTEQFQINVVGLVFFTIAIVPLLEQGREKKVVNVASMLGDLTYTLSNPDLHFASYAVTKAGVNMANAKFHNEFKEKGFTFLSLNPGWVNTELAGEGSGAYAPLQPEESISRCLSFVNRSTFSDSGKFYSLDGLEEAVTH